MNYSCLSEIMMIILPTPATSEDYNHPCRQYSNLKYTVQHNKLMSSTGSQMEKLRHRQKKWIIPQSQYYSDPCSHLGLSPTRVETTPLISVDFFHFMHCCHHLNRWIAAALRLCDYGPVSSHATQNKWKDLKKIGFPCPSVCNGDATASLCIWLGNCAWKGWICYYLAILADLRLYGWGDSSLMLRVCVGF